MRILRRYVFQEALVYFFVTLLAFTGVLLTVKMLRLASLVVNKGVAFKQIATVFLSVIPPFLEIAVPMSTLFGIMFAFARLSGDSEIVVMRASGVSILKLLRPVIIFGLLATAFCLYVSGELRPQANKTLSKELLNIARSKSTAGLDEGVFNKLGKITLYSEKIDHNSGALERVLIDDRRTEMRRIVVAKTGVVVSSPNEASITLLLRDGVIHETAGASYGLTHFDRNKIDINFDQLYENQSLSGELDPGELSHSELAAEIEKMKAQESNLTREDFARTNALITEDARRLSMPFAALVLALAALPLGILQPRTQRTWGVGISASMGLVVFILYYGLVAVGMALSQGGIFSPYFGLWLPNIAGIFATGYLIHRIGTEKWQTVFDIFRRSSQ